MRDRNEEGGRLECKILRNDCSATPNRYGWQPQRLEPALGGGGYGPEDVVGIKVCVLLCVPVHHDSNSAVQAVEIAESRWTLVREDVSQGKRR